MNWLWSVVPSGQPKPSASAAQPEGRPGPTIGPRGPIRGSVLDGVRFRRSHARQRGQPRLRGMSADLAVERDLIEAGDLTLGLDSRRMVERQPGGEGSQPRPDLECEVGRGCTHQGAHVLERHFMLAVQTPGIFGLAHGGGVYGSITPLASTLNRHTLGEPV
jgi:hypothetical protein